MNNEQLIWNLTQYTFTHLKMYTLEGKINNTNEEIINEKLYLLSHQIAFEGIPCCFIPAKSSDNLQTISAVYVCDFFNHFDQFILPSWITINNTVSLNFNEYIQYHEKLCKIFQKAFVLFFLYKFHFLKPLYFSTYLIFPDMTSKSNHIFYRPSPSFFNHMLVLRMIIYDNLPISIFPKFPLSVGNFILVPPIEFPFFVSAIENDDISLTYLNKTIIKVKNSLFHNYILMLKIPYYYINILPPPNYDSLDLFESHSIDHSFDFQQEEINTFSSKDLFNYLCNHFTESGEYISDNDEPQSEIFFSSPTITDLLRETISDPKTRKIISSNIFDNPPSLSLPKPSFPIVSPYNSFFSPFTMNIPFRSPNIPSHFPSLIAKGIFSKINCKVLQIPEVIVNCSGTETSVPANEIFKDWEQKQFQPIAGPKNIIYIVFIIVDNQNSDSYIINRCTSFCQHLESCYSHYLLGSLTLYNKVFPQKSSIIRANKQNIISIISDVVNKNKSDEFLQTPLMALIIHESYVRIKINEKIAITEIHPSCIYSSSHSTMLNLCFNIYSICKTILPSPFGMTCFPHDDLIPFFYNFRTILPYFLSDRINFPCFHVIYDKKNQIASWCNDTGSFLHICQKQTLENILQQMNRVRQLFTDPKMLNLFEMKSITPNLTPVSFSFAFLGHKVHCDDLKKVLDFVNQEQDIGIFTIDILDTVQIFCPKPEYIDNDFLIHTPLENYCFHDSSFAPLLSTGIVTSQKGSYEIGLLSTHMNEEPSLTLDNFASIISRLSWLGMSNMGRTCSYPLHFFNLVQKNFHPIENPSI